MYILSLFLYIYIYIYIYIISELRNKSSFFIASSIKILYKNKENILHF
jgi:hypothetical protein